MATQRQVAANRLNGLKGGPRTPEGRAAVRLNARKHGVFAQALTAEDADELAGLHRELAESLQPVGPLEQMLVDKLAQTYLRMQRCARAEAEYHVRTWQRKTDPGSVERFDTACQEGLHASWFDAYWFQQSVQLFGRYDQTLTNQFIKLLHEIERVQRLRGGEDVPAPLAADVSVSVDAAQDRAQPFVGVAQPFEGLTALSTVEGPPPAGKRTAEGGCATQARVPSGAGAAAAGAGASPGSFCIVPAKQTQSVTTPRFRRRYGEAPFRRVGIVAPAPDAKAGAPPSAPEPAVPGPGITADR